jgi:hypothetical protein
MRRILLALGMVTVALVSGAQSGETRELRPYCLQGGRGTTGGTLDCSYYTWEQCLASIGGGGESCSINPEIGWRALERGRAQPKPRTQRRQNY